MKRGLFRIYLMFGLLVVQVYQAAAQCAMCRGTLESQVSAGETTLAANLNLGILYLFFAPYILLGTLAYFWYRKSKKNGESIVRTSHIAG
jgi:hypothetical protein